MYLFNPSVRLLVLLPLLLLFACSDEGDSNVNEVTITIFNPEPDDTIPVEGADAVRINVDFEATMENHLVELLLYPVQDQQNRIINYLDTASDPLIRYIEEVDLSSFATGTEFQLKASACADDPCGATGYTTVNFKIQ